MFLVAKSTSCVKYLFLTVITPAKGVHHPGKFGIAKNTIHITMVTRHHCQMKAVAIRTSFTEELYDYKL